MTEYAIHAIRYARKEDRRSSANFVGGDPDDRPMPMDFFVWAVVARERTFIIDTGFDERAGRARDYEVSRPVSEGLKQIGIDSDQVDNVVLTHVHWDHAGNHDLFPRAQYHVQEREMHFCTGRCMCQPDLRRAYNAEDVTNMAKRVFEGRVTFHHLDSQLADGISLHWVGGHTGGLQVVRVKTRRGYVVLASDAAHYYANYLYRRPFPVLADTDEMLAGFDRMQQMTDDASQVIPGHDPQVLSLFPASHPDLKDIVRLDGDPLGMPRP